MIIRHFKMDKLLDQGTRLGYEGKQLQNWVKEQQAIEREESGRVRELELAKLAQVEKDRELELAKLAQVENDRELELAKLAQVENDRELEMAKLAYEKELAEANLRLERERLQSNVEIAHEKTEKAARAKDPKLPYFDEAKYKMDSYISRFEKYATANKWERDRWAINLSALLKGRALEVYDRLSNEDAND